jgi:hypothetical protein
MGLPQLKLFPDFMEGESSLPSAQEPASVPDTELNLHMPYNLPSHFCKVR